ncbi:B3/B4 domain-containing protein [Streptomyces sp. NPDC000941]
MPEEIPGLLERLAEVPDSRDPRGVRHAVVVILALTACAVPAGASSLPAVGEWITDAPPSVLQRLGVRPDPLSPNIRPSVDALGRRLAKKGSLPRINPAVDSCNAVSVRHGLPAGAFDLDHVSGDVDIRHADGTESFTPLGEPDTVEKPKPGEIIYADATGVLTRHWNHRDAHRTRVTEDSAHVAFVLETLHVDQDGDLLKIAADELQGLPSPHAQQTAVHHLSPQQSQATA